MAVIRNVRGGLVATLADFDDNEQFLGADKNRQYPAELMSHDRLPIVNAFQNFEELDRPWQAYDDYDLFACTNHAATTYCNYHTALCFKKNMDRAARHIPADQMPVPVAVLRCCTVLNTLTPEFESTWLE